MNDIRLRLLAIERGESVEEPTIEEIRAALLERIGHRQAALALRTESTKRRTRTPKSDVKAIDLEDLM